MTHSELSVSLATTRAVMPIFAALTALTIPSGVSVVTLTELVTGELDPIEKSMVKGAPLLINEDLLPNALERIIVPVAN